MDDGWRDSAEAWIDEMGEYGDTARRYILDPVMLSRALVRSPKNALDVGCGEGRFCRMLKRNGIDTTGLDPTSALLSAARKHDPEGTYVEASAERMPLPDAAFDLVVSYLSLIDIPDIKAAIPDMARVLRPGGALLIANLTSFNSACGDVGWIRDDAGRKLHYPVDNYLDERAMWIEYRKIRIVNYHRPMSAYMRALLDSGLSLTYFDEPLPSADAPPEKTKDYHRAPWFLVMEWVKPG